MREFPFSRNITPLPCSSSSSVLRESESFSTSLVDSCCNYWVGVVGDGGNWRSGSSRFFRQCRPNVGFPEIGVNPRS